MIARKRFKDKNISQKLSVAILLSKSNQGDLEWGNNNPAVFYCTPSCPSTNLRHQYSLN